MEESTVTEEENSATFDDGLPPAGRTVVEQLLSLDLKRAYEAAEEVSATRNGVTLPLARGVLAVGYARRGSALSDAARRAW